MNNKLGSMIISNPKRRGLGYRFRDTSLVLATLSLWGLFGSQAYLTVTSAEFLMEQIYLMEVLKVTAIDFLVVFMVFHTWVIYERLLFRFKVKVETTL
ncbi:hypothetical protein DFO67_1125 [Modicisalibacter xianhensis]|uniref:Uncharacterized protein n=1 Tax=Modicisalibacter xianhensis TaxID=442341 RepID=A0A4R8FYL2_9GAMM|nr:hypothetical protein [Halomonas xianhensis]TDX27791.1 hypothetical protein DFO67_1125 [Halomonas xianhensis]